MTTAIQLDQEDPFQPLTSLFAMPVAHHGQTAIYLNGNSLGPMPKNMTEALVAECESWGHFGVRGHFAKEHPWVSYHERASHSLARLIGAKPQEVVATGTLTANLHFTFISFYRPTKNRYKIICLAGFPSDTYAIRSQIQQRLKTLHDFYEQYPLTLEDAIIEIKPDNNGYISMDTFKQVLQAHGNSTALVWIEAVHFLTGQYFNVPELTALAHTYGCKIGLDLAHAIGNVPLHLHSWNVDFAVWCSYKYLSAGPGAIAGLYIHEQYFTDPKIVRFAGWWGHNKKTRFQLPHEFDPIATAESWQVSNPGILLLTALCEALAIFDQVDLQRLREKNQRLTAYLEQLLLNELAEHVRIITPSNPTERGCQLSFHLLHNGPSFDIEKRLWEQGIICDTRGNLVRVAPMGLYTTFQDVFVFVEKLKEQVMASHKQTKA